MSEREREKQRLGALLKEMQGSLSQRAFARDLKINYASLSSYMLGEQFPETKNLEKIARAKGWDREELEAYLEERTIKSTKSIDEILREVRAMSPEEALLVAKVALDRVSSAF